MLVTFVCCLFMAASLFGVCVYAYVNKRDMVDPDQAFGLCLFGVIITLFFGIMMFSGHMHQVGYDACEEKLTAEHEKSLIEAEEKGYKAGQIHAIHGIIEYEEKKTVVTSWEKRENNGQYQKARKNRP